MFLLLPFSGIEKLEKLSYFLTLKIFIFALVY